MGFWCMHSGEYTKPTMRERSKFQSYPDCEDTMARQWHVKPGETVILPEGSEFMRGGFGTEIWYNPYIDKSYYIVGSHDYGWDVTEYDTPLCPLCWERRERYRQDGF
jgi:hypothetical protein